MGGMELEKFEKFVEAEFIPKVRFTKKENPIRVKILGFLKTFEKGEIRSLKCVDRSEAQLFKSRMAYYSKDLAPRIFGLYVREEPEGFFVYVRRKVDEENGTKELHN